MKVEARYQRVMIRAEHAGTTILRMLIQALHMGTLDNPFSIADQDVIEHEPR
jgi:hypothetical protein